MNNSTKINRVKVLGLFSRFDYNIDFKNDDNVSIFIAPNGCGKTTIFNFLNFLLNPTPSKLLSIATVPFNSFSCLLSNGKTIEITKLIYDNSLNHSSKSNSAHYMCDPNFLWKGNWDFQVTIYDTLKENKTFHFLDTIINDSKVTINRSYFEEENYALSDNELQQLHSREFYPSSKYREIINDDVLKHLCFRLNHFIKENECIVPVFFIKSNRLQEDINKETEKRTFRNEYNNKTNNNLYKIMNEVANNIKKTLDEYNKLLTKAKNKLPSLYLNSNTIDTDYNVFKRRWDLYNTELEKFSNAGLIERTDSIVNPDELENAFSKKRTFLTVYLDAFEETLKPLQSIYDKFRLFADILNKRNEITHKVVDFSSAGISFSVDGELLDLNNLSSGEMNDFIMFYQLIFKTENGGLVLIDEPEVSLHIEWQEEYLDRLLEICRISNLQALVATHSPSIINGHLELIAKKVVLNE